MASGCQFPLTGYRSKYVNPETGKRPLVFNSDDGYRDLPVQFPCGQCIGCRLDRARQWGIRMLHESQMHVENSFITLTYDDDHMPKNGTLVPSDFQKFMKRLRKKYNDKNIRFYHCGEYGDQTFRPHYHAILFGHQFPDLLPLERKNGEYPLYTSSDLATLWPYGFNTIGDVSIDTCVYVAKYVTKKIYGSSPEAQEMRKKRYERLDPDTGEIVNLQPEYSTMSRRPGIGRPWFEKYKSDAFPSDYVIINGNKVKPPKYYGELLKTLDEEMAKDIKYKRLYEKSLQKEDNTIERRETKAKIIELTHKRATESAQLKGL